MQKELIAKVAHSVIAAYCLSLGDESHLPWDEAPDAIKESVLAGVEMHLQHPDATPEQSHDAWLAHKLEAGWQYGETKDLEAKTHPCILPFDELPAEQRAKDFIFRAVVHALKDVLQTQPGNPPLPVGALAGEAKNAQRAGADVPVKYICQRRSQWRDHLYGSGLTFSTGQVRFVPGALARKFLNHADLFERCDFGDGGQGEPAQDDTQQLMDDAARQQQDKREVETQLQDVIDQVNQMTKAGLIEYALTNYKQDLKKTDKLEVLRGQVLQMVNQFGVV